MVYAIKGQQFKKKWGDKTSVWSGDAYWTRGHLTRADLCLNARRVVVSKKKSDASKVRYEKQGFRKQIIEESKLSMKDKMTLLKARRRKRVRKSQGSEQPVAS